MARQRSPRETSTPTDSPRGSLRTSIALLREVSTAAVSGGLGVTELSEKINIHKSTASRLLAVLADEGLVYRDEESLRYLPGGGLVALAGPAFVRLDVREVAAPVIDDLRTSTGETVALMIWAHGAAIALDQAESKSRVRHVVTIGERYSDGGSASVRAFLSAMDPVSREQLAESGAIDPLPADFDESVAEEKANGNFYNDRKTAADEVGIFSLIYNHQSQPIAGLLVAAPAYRVGPGAKKVLGHAVKDAAGEVSRRLGYYPSAETE